MSDFGSGLFDRRNYWDRGIEKPEAYQFTPKEFDDVQQIVIDTLGNILKEDFEERKDELSDHKGIIENLQEYEDNWKDYCRELIDVSEDLDPIRKDLKRLVKKYGKKEEQEREDEHDE